MTTPMPTIKPIPINTKGAGFWRAIRIWLNEPRKFKITKDYTLFVPGVGLIFIPKGFIFDGASVPRLLWFLLSPDGLLLIPGLIHDYGYMYDALTVVDERGNHLTSRFNGQKYWDDLFFDIAVQVNGMKALNGMAWSSLRTFGFIAWNKHRKKGLV